MDSCSYFIEKKALFGRIPNDETIKDLETLGVKYLVDLTNKSEKIYRPYTTELKILHYPIPDRKIPKNALSFVKFVYLVYFLIKHCVSEKEKIYIHCRGGHGRSGIVVACLLGLYYKIPPEVALGLTTFYHRQRRVMRDKWRRIGCPQTFVQKNFVFQMFEPFYFDLFTNNFLHPFSPCRLDTELGTFFSVESAYQAYKNPQDKLYLQRLKKAQTLGEIKQLGKTTRLCENWDYQRHAIMYTLLKLKFDTHAELRDKLLHTYLRPIVYHAAEQSFWKNRKYNRLGKILQKIRNDYFF